MIIQSQTVDLLISHHQISVTSCEYVEEFFQWGDVNVAQGAVLHNNCVTFDSIAEGSFGANVNLHLADSFNLDKRAQRAILVPFVITDKQKLEVHSCFQYEQITLNLTKAKYHLYFEACEENEVFYQFTFVANDAAIAPIYLMDDDWGGVKNKQLELGKK